MADDSAERASLDAVGSSTATAARVDDADDTPTEEFDGVPASALRDQLGVPALHLYARASSALDVAHRLAAVGARQGTLVLADAQTRGRGRGGKHWVSPARTGIWLTLVARPTSADVLRVLTVRLGLAAAVALEPFAEGRIRMKWPNDLYIGSGKLAGVLVEARWRGATPEWVAIGVGVNVVAPTGAATAAGLRAGTSRVAALTALVPALVAAASRDDAVLDDVEMRNYASRDMAAGRDAVAPGKGRVLGITRTAELLVATSLGDVTLTSGSLVLSEES